MWVGEEGGDEGTGKTKKKKAQNTELLSKKACRYLKATENVYSATSRLLPNVPPM